MSSSSPAHSSVSVATSGGGQGGGGAAALVSDDNSAFHFPTDIVSAQDRKDEAMIVLKSDLMATLNKDVKSLDEANWMFAGPRSQIRLISRPSGLLHNQTEIAKPWHSGQLK